MSKNIPAQIADIIKDTLTDQANRQKEHAKGFPVFMTNKDKPAPGTFEFDETGLEFGKVIRAMATARFTNKPAEASIDILKGWGEEGIAKQVADYQAKAMQSGTPVAGGFLVPETFSREIIDFLRPQSIVRAAMPRYLAYGTRNRRDD